MNFNYKERIKEEKAKLLVMKMEVPQGEPVSNVLLTEEEGVVRVKAVQLSDDDVVVLLSDGLNEVEPPTFVKKTFEMVSDPETDPIVSWSATRDSFVVWDSHEFSTTLLPKYFKHNNFSSFIRQLNTYGFRKVDSERWEFANEGFQGGKKHLLRKIKRRSKYNKLLQARALEDEVEQLKKDHNMLIMEIMKLKQQHEDSQIQLTNFEERVRSAELKQYQMLGFITTMTKKLAFVEQLIHKMKRGGAATVKRLRFATKAVPNVDYRHQGYESYDQMATLQSELSELLSEIVNPSNTPSVSPVDDDLCSSIQGLRNDVSNVESEKLMGESSDIDEEVDVNGSNIYLELEGLISGIGSASEFGGAQY